MDIDQIIEDFEFIDDWEDRYRYIIELGNQLEPYPDVNKTPETKVKGCVSQVWLTTQLIQGDGESDVNLHFSGESDAHIVRGLMAIVFGIFSDKPPSEIVKTDYQGIFNKLDLKDHISPQRSNGLNAMVQRIQHDAEAALKDQSV